MSVHHQSGSQSNFLALTFQKMKLSDDPVEAEEDYTKFNSNNTKTKKVSKPCIHACFAEAYINIQH